MTRNDRHLTVDDLKTRIAAGEIDTVVVAFTDMQGRLQGKRLHGAYFVDEVLGHGTEGCNYLLGVDVDMNTVRRLRDHLVGPGLRRHGVRPGPRHASGCCRTCRPPRWSSATWRGPTTSRSCSRRGRSSPSRCSAPPTSATSPSPAPSSSSSSSRTPTSRRTTWATATSTPSNQYNVDYSILGTTRVEPLLRDIRNAMYAAGMNVEGAKGECNFGQHEIGFLYDDVVVTADNHAVYKTMAKEIAAQHGKSITFMAKFNEREGNSCHIHLSLRGADGEIVFWDDDAGERTPLYDSFVAGVLATMADFTLLYAPNINSYKRFAEGSFAPTAIAWGEDNRTCAVRLVGQGRRRPDGEPGPGRRREPLPRARRDDGRRPARRREGAAARSRRWRATPTRPTRPRVPHTLQKARDAFTGSASRGPRFGDEVVDHYTNMADVELKAFNAAVTDWELRRGLRKDVTMTTHTVLNPATAEPVTEVPLATVEDTDAHIARASEAFPAWRDLAPGERARLLRRFAAVVDEHVDELADLEVRNAGHTLSNARWEAGNVRDVLNYYSAAPERLFGRQIPVAGGVDVTFHEPLGVVGVIVPWNFPMPIAGWGFAPGARGRQHRRAQARRADPAHRDPPRRARRSRPGCPRASSR